MTKTYLHSFLIGFICFVQILNSQTKNEVYVILDDSSLFELKKKNNKAFLEIPYYSSKEECHKKESDLSSSDIVKFRTKSISYEFLSIESPKKVSSINSFKTFSVVDVSKEKKEVWKDYPYYINFIEKIDYNNYNLWKMKPEFKQ